MYIQSIYCSGCAMVLGKLPVPGDLLIWKRVRQGATVLTVGAVGVVWTFFSRLSFLSSISLSFIRFRLKYCLKRPLNPNEPTNFPKST